MEDIQEIFMGRIADPKSALEQLDANATVGEAMIDVAVFGVVDSGKPVGVPRRQVIDRGAFRTVLKSRDFDKHPTPYLLDHGHAHVRGFVDQRLKIGKADRFRETDQALEFRGLFNLRKQNAREAFSDMLFDPDNTPHSFRWSEDETYVGDDGYEHVTAFDDVEEVSSVGRGAQALTGVHAGTVHARSAIAAHSTETYDSAWDAGAQVAKIPDDAGASVLRRMFAWVDAKGDPAAKGSYKFPHHTVTGGTPGAANVNGAQAIIANLNGARNSPGIPSADRGGVYAHAARHIRDAGDTPAPLRASLEEIQTWAGEDEEFKHAVAEVVGTVSSQLDTKELTARSWIDAMALEELKRQAIEELRNDSDARTLLRVLLEKAEESDPITAFYGDLWNSRANR